MKVYEVEINIKTAVCAFPKKSWIKRNAEFLLWSITKGSFHCERHF